MTAPLPDGLLEAVRERLAADEPVRRNLPDGGRLHIDRQLPFLVVYRRPSERRDPGTRRLVLSQASYLTASGDRARDVATRELVTAVVETLSAVFGAFLIVEIWTAVLGEEDNRDPLVRVVTPDQQAALGTVDDLAGALEDLEVGYWRPEIRQSKAKSAAPPGLPSLLDPVDANRLNCFFVGLQLDPVFRSDAGVLYPELIRQLTVQLSAALQQGFFTFNRTTTPGDKAASWQGLGRRSVVRAVRRVDAALGKLSSEFDFLLGVTPVDAGEAWEKFKESTYTEPPSFRYRPLTTDPELMLRELYQVPLEHVEDPTLDRIFREKLREVARKLTMFAERNTHRFLHGSLQLYGGVEPDLLALADDLLAAIPDEGDEEGVVDAEDFAQLATVEFARYREQSTDFDAELDIRDDISGLMVSHGTLLIDRNLSLTPSRAHALLHHEVGTHVVTWMNGRSQPLHIFRTGLAGYEQMQEGLAVLAEFLVGGLTPGRLSLLAARVVAVERMVRGASFVEIFDELTRVYGLGPRTAFTATMRVTRGGGLTKDAVYLRGLREVVGYLREGGDLELLYIGKIALAHVPVAQELLYRGVLHASPLRPTCLDAPGAARRLSKLREGMPIVQMYERKT